MSDHSEKLNPHPRNVHTVPVHTKVRESPLSSESGEQNFRGFINLGTLILVVNLFRLAIENFLKYGSLISIPGKSVVRSDWINALKSFFLQLCFLFLALCIEKMAIMASKYVLQSLVTQLGSSGKKINRTDSNKEHFVLVQSWNDLIIGGLHAINISALILVSCYISYSQIIHPFVSGLPLMTSVILVMKLISYALVNMELCSCFYEKQIEIIKSKKLEESVKVINGSGDTLESLSGSLHLPKENKNLMNVDTIYTRLLKEFIPSQDSKMALWPQCSTLGNLLYFYLAPTLCYQPVYVRSPHEIRWKYIFKRLLQTVSGLVVMYMVILQYITPTVQNSLKPMDDFNLLKIAERILKLSIPSLIVWLLMFYSVFHTGMNLMAELLRFGDRQFYKPFWNAQTLDEYWRQWNVPVHTWFRRHLYTPLHENYKLSRTSCGLLIFFLSAVFHEMLVAIPTKIFTGWAFLAMIMQMPLIHFSRKIKRPNSSVGNYLFWCSFCILGQPMCVLLYYRAYYVQNFGSSR